MLDRNVAQALTFRDYRPPDYVHSIFYDYDMYLCIHFAAKMSTDRGRPAISHKVTEGSKHSRVDVGRQA